MKRKKFGKGEQLMRENDLGEVAYVIEHGRVAITKQVGDRQVALATLGPGDPVGEMSMIDDKPRSATATAIENVEVREIHQDDLLEAIQTDPSVGMRVLGALFERLREADAAILALQSRGDTPPAPAEPEEQPTATLEALTPEASAALPEPRVRIEHFPFRIGRQSHNLLVRNDLELADEPPWQISRHHVAVVCEEGRIGVVDRGSRLGAEVDGHRIGGSARDPGPVYLESDEATLLLGKKRSPFQFRLVREAG